MPEGITKRKVVPVVLPFGTVIGKGPKTKTGAKPIDSKKLETSTEKKPAIAKKPNVRLESVKTGPVMQVLPRERAEAPIASSQIPV